MSDKTLKEITEIIDMEYYLDREGVDYTVTHGSSGVQLNVRECPICGSTESKVYLNADTGLGNCFAGRHPPGENFSLWNFAKALHGFENNRDVFTHLKDIAVEIGWRARKTVSVDVDVEKPDLAIPDSYELPVNGKNLKYLIERGIDSEMAKYFHLRYCVKGWFKYMFDGQEKYQCYHSRVIVPIFDIDGGLVSFQGRDVTDKSDKKYLFPPGFSATGEFLYNAHNAVRAKRVAVGEGVFDVMAIKIALDDDVALRDVVPVGTFGKHLSHGNDGKDQLSKFLALKRDGLEEVTFIWDGEVLALKAAVNAGILLKGIGLTVRIAQLPDDKDPNEVPPGVLREAYWGAKLLNSSFITKVKLMKG